MFYIKTKEMKEIVEIQDKDETVGKRGLNSSAVANVFHIPDYLPSIGSETTLQQQANSIWLSTAKIACFHMHVYVHQSAQG